MENKAKQQTPSSNDDMRVSEDDLDRVAGGLVMTPDMAAKQNAELAKHGQVVGHSKGALGMPVDTYQDGTKVFHNGLGPLIIRTPSH
jgi:hypothetical protein